MLTYVTDNRDHLQRYSPVYPNDYYTLDYWKQQLTNHADDFQNDKSLHLCLYEKECPNTVIGTIHFSSIIRRAAQFCFLGYGIAHKVEGRGYMKEALRASITYAFEEMNLHRIMANYVPTNERSGRLLKSLGFVAEGYARDYLRINGEWQDHVMTALINQRWLDEKLKW